MNSIELQQSMIIIEDICKASGRAQAFNDSDILVLKYQNGANDTVKEKVRCVLEYDDCHIAIEVMPQESKLHE